MGYGDIDDSKRLHQVLAQPALFLENQPDFIRFLKKTGRKIISRKFFAVKDELFTAGFLVVGVFNANMEVFSPEIFMNFQILLAFGNSR